MKRSTKVIAAVLLIAASSSAVFAFSKQGHWKMTPDEKIEFVTDRVTEKLELDDQQRQNFTDLAGLVTQIMIEAKANKAQHIDEIKGMLQDPNFDQLSALELVQKKTQLINEKAPLVISSLAMFLDSLNSEQKLKMQSLLEHHGKHHLHADDK
jgi:Spy/CpxP family protein refolding chaperone